MTPWGLVNCKVFGSQEPSLTNRMSELLTYGSVGGVGRKPDPYPALDAAMTILLTRNTMRKLAKKIAERSLCFYLLANHGSTCPRQ
jgi:hypothetical protein